MNSPWLSRATRSLLLRVGLLLALPAFRLIAQEATITESVQIFRTYPFSDPDPVGRMGNIYPYFRFHGYSMSPSDRPWKVVTMENAYIRVLIAPEIGGKILGAFEKATGRAFIYYNRVMKFREIAMRGPWTSGGIEFNFGDIGHTPTTATPVDYVTRKNADGSVSCVVGALDLPSRTEWRVEIRLPGDKALFETRSFWYNPTPVSTSLYHWMNAAADADSTLQVLYPGKAFIGHAGEASQWPIDREGRDLSSYRNNAFGSYKSYHVLGTYTDWFGARWNNFGVVHWSRYTDKPGKKLWIWGLSREGEIWKSLLTDSALGNSQYVELQSGLHFNQAITQSSRTPFKHMAFLPQTSERFTEAWFPFKDLTHAARATPDGVLEVRSSNGKLCFGFCPTGVFKSHITVVVDGNTRFARSVDLQPLQSFRDSIALGDPATAYEIRVGNLIRYRSSDDQTRSLERPITEQIPFDWTSAYGLTIDARERVRQRDPESALASYCASLKKDPTFLPALSGSAELYLRRMDYDSALTNVKRGLAIDSYDPEINYLYGLLQRRLMKPYDARDGFGVAARSATYRPAAYLQLAEMAFIDSQYTDAADFALQASQADAYNVSALQLLAVLARYRDDSTGARTLLSRIHTVDPLNHFARFELLQLSPTAHNRDSFVDMIRNELPHESFLELAAYYSRLGLIQDALTVLSLAPVHPIVDIWHACLAARTGRDSESRQLLDRALATSPFLVFPHRQEDRDVLLWAAQRTPHWKTSYYLALLAWNLGRRKETQRYFAQCNDLPDFAPFYLTRAGFRSDDPHGALTDLRRAVQLDPGEWRTHNALVSFLNTQGEYQEALQVCVRAVARCSSSYVLKFLLARTFLFNKNYSASHAILDTLALLPFEGARYGHDAYRQACVLLAVETLLNKDVASARSLLNQARSWPERLGAGKPYDVDTRLEDYVEASAFMQLGDQKGSERMLSSVNEYTHSHKGSRGAQQLIGALALRDSRKNQEARALLNDWIRGEPDSQVARWALAVFEKKTSLVLEIEQRLQPTLLNRTTGDQEFILVRDLVTMLRW
jgi:tetratricopeptide (TPR) repeat protein